MAKEMIKATGYFGGLNSKGTFDVQFKVKFYGGELFDALRFTTAIGNTLDMALSVGSATPKRIGKFVMHAMKIGRDGDSVITFKSNIDSVNMEAFTAEVFNDEENITVFAKIIPQ
jgi:hypothetical protein